VIQNRRIQFSEKIEKSVNKIEGLGGVYDIDDIIDERDHLEGSRKIKQYQVQWVGYSPEWDSWLNSNQLRNAPEVLRNWRMRRVKSKATQVLIPQ
jgi:hypothetical protein